MIHIIDYGVGNIQALLSAYRRLDIPAKAITSARQIGKPSHFILPGVGAFDQAMSRFNASGMRGTVEEFVLRQRVPVLGICVGMQMLASRSEEGQERGLGWVDAEVCRIPNQIKDGIMPLPHMGWNEVCAPVEHPLFLGMGQSPAFYFLHSFFMDKLGPSVLRCDTTYGFQFASVVQQGNVYGVQFHPEKSHDYGLKLLRNFSET